MTESRLPQGGPSRDGVSRAAAGPPSGEGGSIRVRQTLLLAVKIIVSAGLFGWIATLIDWGSFWKTLVAAEVWVLGLVLVLRLLGILLSAVKWQRLLAIHGVRFRLGSLTRWYLTGMFFNHLLPTTLGGDGFRIYKTFQNPRGGACAVIAVFTERATGVAAILALGWLAALLAAQRGDDPVVSSLVPILSAALLAGAIGAWAVFRHGILEKSFFSTRLPNRLKALPSLLRDYTGHPRLLASVILISFVFHLNRIAIFSLLLFSVGATPGLLEITVTLLLADIAGVIPISLGGLGVVDGTFVYFMGHYGVARESGLASMLLARALLLPFSLAGAWFYARGEGGSGSLTSRTGAIKRRLSTL